jgi:hypothetical protein
MSSSYTVGYIVGSLSTESINRTLSKALIRLAPENLKLVEIPIRDLPVYNRDFDADYPPAGRALKDAIPSTPYCSSPRSTTAAYPAVSRTPSTGQAAHGERILSPASRRP